MPISFKKPPINEVALGYTFLSRPDFLVPHFGRFWAKIEDAYPTCQHASPVVDEGGFDYSSEFLLPRVWFVGADNSRLIQLQQDRLVFNWRSTGADTPYIRFPEVLREFERVRGLFEAYVEQHTGQGVQPSSYTLSYVNAIKRDAGLSCFESVGSTFPDVQWQRHTRFLPQPKDLSWKAKFELPNEFGHLVADIQPGKLVRTNEAIIKLELAAMSGSLGGKSVDFNEWVTVAHEWIVNAFKDLTHSDLHKQVWLIEDDEA